MGINANCEQFQINDRTGSKLVAIDASQIQVYTDDLTILSGTSNAELNFYLSISCRSKTI